MGDVRITLTRKNADEDDISARYEDYSSSGIRAFKSHAIIL